MMSEKTKKIIKLLIVYWLPFIVWAVVIFSFSSIPTVRTSEIHWRDFVVKKTAHIVEFFIFSLLLYRAMVNSNMKTDRLLLVTVIFAAFLYGLTDEYHQSFTPGRGPMLRDVAIDTSGSVLFILSLKHVVIRNEKLSKLAKMLQLVR